jgi:hypothetical protein
MANGSASWLPGAAELEMDRPSQHAGQLTIHLHQSYHLARSISFRLGFFCLNIELLSHSIHLVGPDQRLSTVELELRAHLTNQASLGGSYLEYPSPLFVD